MGSGSIERAHRILDVARHFGTQAGGTLFIAQIHARSASAGWGNSYIAEALTVAVQNKWLLVNSSGSFDLTETGHAEMVASVPKRSRV